MKVLVVLVLGTKAGSAVHGFPPLGRKAPSRFPTCTGISIFPDPAALSCAHATPPIHLSPRQPHGSRAGPARAPTCTMLSASMEGTVDRVAASASRSRLMQS